MEYLFLFLGIGALLAMTVSFDGNSEPEPEDDDLTLERDEDGRFILHGTSGADLILPMDIENAQQMVQEQGHHFARLAEIRGGAGNDTIVADAYGHPDDDRHLSGQDGMRIYGGPGDDLIISHGTFSNTLYGGGGDDTLIGVGADMHGGSGDDLIIARSYDLGEEARVMTLRGGHGDDTIAVVNGYADIRGGEGSDTFILEYDRPAVDDQQAPPFPLERGFPGIGDVVIRDFDPEEDRLVVLLPPQGSENVELESISREGEHTRILLRVDIAPYFEFEQGTTFRAAILLQNVDVVDDVELSVTEDGVILSVNTPPEVPVLPALPV